MKTQNLFAKTTLWVNRVICLVMVVLAFTMPLIIRWYSRVRTLTPTEQTAITVGFYICFGMVAVALWTMDGLLRAILREEVFVRENVRRIRILQWCCGLVSLVCFPTAFFYLPLIFLAVIMAFLCLVVKVVACVMDAAVTIREENDLTI